MEFSIQLNHTIAKEAKIKKEIWSVEDCKKYVEKNSHLPNSQKGISLHKLLQKSKFIVEEKKEVSEFYIFDSESEKIREKKISEEEGYQLDIKTGETNSEKILDGKEGGYYFEFIQTVDQIPLYQFDREKNGITIPGFRVSCIYTQEGIEYLEASKVYEIVKAEEDISILNVDAVINLLCEKLDNIIITGKLDVTEMELIYVPTEEAVLMPVWKIVIQDAEEEVLVYFDAETGKELLL